VEFYIQLDVAKARHLFDELKRHAATPQFPRRKSVCSSLIPTPDT
jgi:hypothetical protein